MSTIAPLSRVIARFLLLRLFVPGVVVLVSGALIWGIWARRETEADQEYHARAITGYATSYLDQAVRLLSLATERSQGRDATREDFRTLLDTSESFHRALLLNRDWQVLLSVPSGAASADFSGLVGEHALADGVDHGGMILTAPYYSVVAGSVVVGLGHPIDDDRLVLGELRLEQMQKYVGELSGSSPGESVFVTDRYGNMIAHTEVGLVEEQTNVGDLEIVRRLAAGSGSDTVVERLDGRLSFLSGAREPRSGWLVITAQDAVAVFSPAFLPLVLAVLALLVLLALAAVSLDRQMEHTVIAPIREFAEDIQAVRVGAGEPETRHLETPGFRELQDLYQGFYQMKQAIHEREEDLRASRERWRFALEGAGDGVWDWAIRRGVVFYSRRYLEIVGFGAEEFGVTLDSWKNGIHPEDRPEVLRGLTRTVDGLDSLFTAEYRFLCRDGSYKWILSRGKIVEWDENGRGLRMIASHADVTARREGEEALRSADLEKASLLKEIHHRVKNNLNIASSLLSLQSDQIESVEDAREALLDSRNRIYSMARVHEELYKSENLSTVDMREYIDDLTWDLLRAYGQGERIQLSTSVEEVYLDISHAVPCGIILNELISNAIRHAFPDGRSGGIGIVFARPAPGQYELTVSDDGVGLPAEEILAERNSLGLRLIQTLTTQLDGALEISRSSGTVFRISWSAEESEHATG